jgi:hypothetical protein
MRAMLAHQQKNGDGQKRKAREKRSRRPEAPVRGGASVVMRMLMLGHGNLLLTIQSLMSLSTFADQRRLSRLWDQEKTAPAMNPITPMLIRPTKKRPRPIGSVDFTALMSSPCAKELMMFSVASGHIATTAAQSVLMTINVSAAAKPTDNGLSLSMTGPPLIAPDQ